MVDLQAIFEAIEQLEPQEMRQVQRRIDEYLARRPENEDVETRLAELHAGLAAFREGLSPERLEDLLLAMGTKYAQPTKDLGLFDWIDDLPEEER